ncbi:MAG: helix-turn-helix domain-containing protein [bacterium]
MIIGSPLSSSDQVTVMRSEEPVTDARLRIVEAAIRCIAHEGVHGASMALIAADTGVSKALLHYHFTDRAQLLSEVVRTLSTRLATRERGAIEHAQAARTVDALWAWLENELRQGELRALLELQLVRDASLREVLYRAATIRRNSATATVERLFAQLELTPRVPVDLIGDAALAFVDGLVLNDEMSQRARVSFDVFWLAILSLGD